MSGDIHSEWVTCPYKQPGDETTQLAKLVTCQYCRDALRLAPQVRKEQSEKYLEDMARFVFGSKGRRK